jgi:hypothetical protein
MSRTNFPQELKRANSSFSMSSTIGGTELSDTDSTTGSIDALTPAKMSEFWLIHKHHGFTPNPRAAVHDEIMRLATLKCWSHNTRLKRRTEALAAELALYDDGKDRLGRWQQLCVEVGVAELNDLPTSISACKKVGPRLRKEAFSFTVFDQRAEAQSGAHQHLQPFRPPTKPPDDPSSPLQLLLRSLFVHPGRPCLPETNCEAGWDH